MSNLDVIVQRSSCHKTNKSTFAFWANCWWKIKYFSMQRTKLSTSQRCGIKCPLLCFPLLGHWVIQCHSKLLQRMLWLCLIPHASIIHGCLSLGSELWALRVRPRKEPKTSLCFRSTVLKAMLLNNVGISLKFGSSDLAFEPFLKTARSNPSTGTVPNVLYSIFGSDGSKCIPVLRGSVRFWHGYHSMPKQDPPSLIQLFSFHFCGTSILDAGAVVEILFKLVSPCSGLHVTTTVVAACCTSDSKLWAACQCVCELHEQILQRLIL